MVTPRAASCSSTPPWRSRPGILAAQVLALHDTSIAGKLEAFKEYQDDVVQESVKNVRDAGYRNEFD